MNRLCGLARLVLFAPLVLLVGCGESKDQQVELQFSVATLRQNARVPVDCDEHFLLSIPLTVRRGKAKVTAVHNGIWMDVAWDDLRRARGRDAAGALEFRNFRYSIRNPITISGEVSSSTAPPPKRQIIRYRIWTITYDRMLTGAPHPRNTILFHKWRLCSQGDGKLDILIMTDPNTNGE